MANTENSLEHVEVPFFKSDDLDRLVNIQKSLQERIQPGFYSPFESVASIADFFMKNKHALEDEMGETLDALGGIHDGFGSAAWKWWKQDNKGIAQETTFSMLSERDQKEVKFEIADQLHFLLNQMVKIGMTGSELYSIYLAKNQVNIDRQDNGY